MSAQQIGTTPGELANQLADATDDFGEFGFALRAVLRVLDPQDESCSAEDGDTWGAIAVLAGLPIPRFYEDHPASADAVCAAGARLLANLGNAVSSTGSNGEDSRVEWDVTYAWIAETRRAYGELGTALSKLEADAGRLTEVEPS